MTHSFVWLTPQIVWVTPHQKLLGNGVRPLYPSFVWCVPFIQTKRGFWISTRTRPRSEARGTWLIHFCDSRTRDVTHSLLWLTNTPQVGGARRRSALARRCRMHTGADQRNADESEGSVLSLCSCPYVEGRDNTLPLYRDNTLPSV